MLPLRLTIQNFLCYRDNVPPLNLAGVKVACLCGPNGAGKSSLLDAITWALWGKGRSSSLDDYISYGADECYVSLEFQARDNVYRALRRRRRPAARRAAGVSLLELQILDGESAHALTGTSINETQRRINQLVGMDYDTFINSAFLVQGRSDEFTRKTPGERKEALANILGLDIYDRLQARARAALRQRENDANETVGKLSALQGQEEEIGDPATELIGVGIRLEDVGRQLETRQSQIYDLRRQVEQLKQLKQQLAEGQRALAGVAQDLEQLLRSQAAAQQRVAACRELLGQAEAISGGVEKLRAARLQYEALEEARQEQQRLDTRRQAVLGRIERQRAELQFRADQLEARIRDELTPRAESLPAWQAKQGELEAQGAKLAQDAASVAARLEEQAQAIDALREQVGELRRQRQQAADTQKQAANLTEDIRRQENALAQLRQQVGQAQAIASQSAAIQEGMARLERARQEYTALDETRQRHDALTAQANHLRQDIAARRAAAETEIRQLERRIQELAPVIGRRPELEARLAETERQQAELEEAAASLSQRRALLTNLVAAIAEAQSVMERHKQEGQDTRSKLELLTRDQQSAACPLCGSALGHEGCLRLAQTYEADILQKRQLFREHQARLKQLEMDKASLEAALPSQEAEHRRQQQAAQTQAATLTTQLAETERAAQEQAEKQAELAEKRAALQAGRHAPAQLEELRRLEKQLADLSYSEAARQAAYQESQRLAQWERQAHQLEEAQRRLPELEAARQDALAQLERRRNELAELEAALTWLAAAAASLPRQDAALTEAQQRQASLNEQAAALLRQERVSHAALLQAQQRVAEAQQAEFDLAAARQTLAEACSIIEARQYAVSEQGELADLGRSIAALGYDAALQQQAFRQIQSLQPFEAQAAQLEQARRQLPAEEEGLAQATDMAERRRQEQAAWQEKLRQWEAASAALPQREAELRGAEAAEAELRQAQQAALERRGHLEAQLRRLNDTRAARAAAEARLKQLQEEQGIYQELVTAFGRQGVQAMLIETVVPRIRDEANRLLERLTDGRLTVEMETQRENRAGRINETLEITVSDELGPRPYEMYSGGEAFRVNLALRIALSKALAQRQGVPLSTLFIDEGFGTQDAAGRERILDALRTIQDEFNLIIVITHLDDLKDAFPVRIEAQKLPDGSTFAVEFSS